MKKQEQNLLEYIIKYLYNDKTKLVYDIRRSLDEDGAFADLPTAEEIALGIPNPCGWQSGMEDCMIHAGTMLTSLINEYKLSQSSEILELARNIFEGIKACSEISGVKGFLARAIHPADGKSYYTNSSRDQYTLAVHGLLCFYDSEMPTDTEKSEIEAILCDFADLCLAAVTPENGYRINRCDGGESLVCEMWGDIWYHEVFRLPMIYLAAYHVSGREKYLSAYSEICDEAVEKSIPKEKINGIFAYQQMFKSLEVALKYDSDSSRKEKIYDIVEVLCGRALEDINVLMHKVLDSEIDLSELCPSWRTIIKNEYMFGRPIGGKAYYHPRYAESFNDMLMTLRNMGACMYILSFAGKVTDEIYENYIKALEKIDLPAHGTDAPVYLLEGLMAYRAAQIGMKAL